MDTNTKTSGYPITVLTGTAADQCGNRRSSNSLARSEEAYPPTPVLADEETEDSRTTFLIREEIFDLQSFRAPARGFTDPRPQIFLFFLPLWTALKQTLPRLCLVSKPSGSALYRRGLQESTR